MTRFDATPPVTDGGVVSTSRARQQDPLLLAGSAYFEGARFVPELHRSMRFTVFDDGALER